MYQLVSIPRFTLLDAGALGLSGKMGYPAHVAPVLSPLTEMFWCVCVCARVYAWTVMLCAPSPFGGVRWDIRIFVPYLHASVVILGKLFLDPF